mgnify:FL=1
MSGANALGGRPEVIVEGYTLYRESSFTKLKPGEAITVHRPKPETPAPGKKASSDSIVRSACPTLLARALLMRDGIARFKNSNGVEIGRISEKDASWISKLLDLEILSLAGTCVHCEKGFKSGESFDFS